jgi:hypothetical protein
MDRIDHPSYFSLGFACQDLDSFMQQIHTLEDAYSNRSVLNLFFDRLIASNLNCKSIYVRVKWLVYLHKLIQIFDKKSVMFKFVIRAL